MKSLSRVWIDLMKASLPARGAWIEIAPHAFHGVRMGSLPARGAWIEMFAQPPFADCKPRRSPHGERGLKSCADAIRRENRGSLPARGAWIEIGKLLAYAHRLRSLPARGAWIEIPTRIDVCDASTSLPARGAWIEISSHMSTVCAAKSRSPHGERGLKYRFSDTIRP